MALVLFDLDGTLTRGPSAERLFIGELLFQNVLGPRQIAAFLWFGPLWVRRFGKDVWKKDKAYLTGLSVEETARRAAW